jgi:beta-glucuronidase
MENPGYDQLHTNPVESLLSRKKATFETLLCGGREPCMSLDGSWTASPDIYDNGIRASWYLESGGEFDRRAPRDYDFESWDAMDLPACWNTRAEAFSLYEGSFWFFRTFPAIDNAAGQRIILRFEAVNYVAIVFVNGIQMASHEGGFTPFCADITDALLPEGKPGDNRLLVWVNNSRKTDGVPADFTDWFNYGGIYRNVSLYRVPETRIADWSLTLDPSGRYDSLRLSLSLNAPVSKRILIRVADLIDREAWTDDGGHLVIDIAAQPVLWDTDNPFLYPVELCCGEDILHDEVGFRRVEVRGNRVYLNGHDVFLRGITAHEESVANGRALTLEEIRSTLELAKEMHCNFMRLAHYPHSGIVSRMADRLGIMLWEEIPVYWSLDFSNPATLANANNQLEELMKRDRNRASVIVWAVGNENPDSDERYGFMKSLIGTVRNRDPGRLVSAACLLDLQQFKITDRLTSEVDIVGINEYFGWYYYGYEKLARLLEHGYGKPVVVSEFGAEAVAGLHGGPDQLWTEEYQAEVYRNQMDVIMSSRAAGIAPWLLYDFKTPRRLNARQKMYNLKGLLDRTKTVRKKAFYLVRDYYLKALTPT